MTVVQQAVANGSTVYRRRRPEGTLLYRTVQTHFATWLALARDGQGDPDAVPGYVERKFRRYLECGILAHGFARARCGACGHDLPVAFSCKERGVCPSCNVRCMVEIAAHLTDHVLPRLPVRQWVLSVPKRWSEGQRRSTWGVPEKQEVAPPRRDLREGRHDRALFQCC
jgi:hypothetical protein